jgi:hypothetical protein
MGFTREQIVREFAHIFARFGFDTREPAKERLVESVSADRVSPSGRETLIASRA